MLDGPDDVGRLSGSEAEFGLHLCLQGFADEGILVGRHVLLVDAVVKNDDGYKLGQVDSRNNCRLRGEIDGQGILQNSMDVVEIMGHVIAAHVLIRNFHAVRNEAAMEAVELGQGARHGHVDI